MSDETSAPVVVVHHGRRYVLNANGVTRVVLAADFTPRRGAYTTRTPGGPVFVPTITRGSR